MKSLQRFLQLSKMTFLLSKNVNNAKSFRFRMQYLNCSNLSHCTSTISFPFLKDRYLLILSFCINTLLFRQNDAMKIITGVENVLDFISDI